MSHRTCTEEGCTQAHSAKGLCKKHYRRKSARERRLIECKFPDCSRPASGARGWCWTHYDRWRRHGDPAQLGPRGERGTVYSDPVEAFDAKAERTDGCWYWRGKSAERGAYGTIWSEGKNVLVHRWSYEHHNGKAIPDGYVIDHLCRTANCVNPDHLEAVTLQENSRRATRPRPEFCGRGHRQAGDVVRQRKDGGVYCGECANHAQRARRAKRRAAREAQEWLDASPTHRPDAEKVIRLLMEALS